MKNQIWMIGIMLSVALFVGCGSESDADKEQREQTEQAMKEMQAQVGMPAIVNFQERKLAKMIFELRDQENLVCYAYIVNKMQGKLIFIGKCIGFGLPYSVQFTNPMKPVHIASGHWLTLPQPDPNGLFMPSGLSATWLMIVDPKDGDARPVYIEPEIIVSPFRLH